MAIGFSLNIFVIWRLVLCENFVNKEKNLVIRFYSTKIILMIIFFFENFNVLVYFKLKCCYGFNFFGHCSVFFCAFTK